MYEGTNQQCVASVADPNLKILILLQTRARSRGSYNALMLINDIDWYGGICT